MSKFYLILLFCIILITSCASAEGRICASGTATVFAPADCASVSLGINYDGEDVAELQTRANETVHAICEALNAEGLSENELSTGNFNINALYEYRESDGRRVQTGYNVSNTLSITTENISSLGAYIDAAFAAGANDFHSVRFSLKNSDVAKKEALKLAVENGIEKASVMAAALGKELGDLVEVCEGSRGSYSYAEEESYSNDLVMKAAAGSEVGTTILASQIAVSANVEIVFEAK